MKTYFLKFANEDEAIEQLVAHINPEGEWMTSRHEYALDVVGTIHKPTGAMLDGEDGSQYPELEPIEGFHVNLAIGELPEALILFEIVPDTPSRVFS